MLHCLQAVDSVNFNSFPTSMYDGKVIMNRNHTWQSQLTLQTGLPTFLKNDSSLKVVSQGWS